jgi:hypothetical protein
MSIKRITISVPEAVARRIKKAAGKTPVSAWLTDVALEHLEEAELERQWQAFYLDVSPKAAEVRRAEVIFKNLFKHPAKPARRGAA